MLRFSLLLRLYFSVLFFRSSFAFDIRKRKSYSSEIHKRRRDFSFRFSPTHKLTRAQHWMCWGSSTRARWKIFTSLVYLSLFFLFTLLFPYYFSWINIFAIRDTRRYFREFDRNFCEFLFLRLTELHSRLVRLSISENAIFFLVPNKRSCNTSKRLECRAVNEIS